MNRLVSLALSMLLMLTGCVGNAAAPADDPAPEQTAAALTDTAPSEDTEPTPPAGEAQEAEEAQEPEEPYVRIIDPSKPMVALTFDDGPSGETSGQILDILEKNHALATFFEVGRNVLNYPEPVKRMAEMGCEVASHSNVHANLSKMSKAALLQDLNTADQAFVSAGAPAPTLVRPPYGAVNYTVKSATGRAMITWSVDTLDWKSRDAQTVIDYIKNYGNLDGEIVLMHSIYSSTVEAVEVLVPWLQEQGYQLVTVTELMAYYYGELPQPDCFYGYTYFSTHERTDTPIELPSMFPPAAEEETSAPTEAPAEGEPPPAQETDAAPVAEWTPEKVEAAAKASGPTAPGTI